MQEREDLLLSALFREYEALSTEKQIHKRAIRNVQVYLASLISAGVTLLAFLGLPVDSTSSPRTLQVVGSLLLAALVPGTLVVIAFAVNDFYQVYVMSRQLSSVETRVNRLLVSKVEGRLPAMSWEGIVCPVVFGGKPIMWHTASGRERKTRLLRPAGAGNILAILYLAPLLYLAASRSFQWLWGAVGPLFAVSYLALVLVSVAVVGIYFGFAVWASYAGGPLQHVFQSIPANSKKVGSNLDQ